ncbi:alpha/beta hydrolase [Sphingomonas ginkgonis]|uniref:Alpha/beta hydrolase n=1 Tax=Sphingomonas ginkgonis TaxID=2315330 RepID=A0A3R9WMJ8_9SPHN|nr:alpha/beta hydrolase [Sphingomonas ginkgonis]RST29974.1 alpha/beta hydrolase [Sphingomonas ginkgonis]
MATRSELPPDITPPATLRPRRRKARNLKTWGATFARRLGWQPVDLLNTIDRYLPTRSGANLAAQGVAYGLHPRQRLDVWTPSARRHRGQPLPVVVFFYGGGWHRGERSHYAFAGAALSGEGFVVVVPDYRLVPEGRFPAMIEDGAEAIRWVRDHAHLFGGDPERISVCGHSAGAYIGAMLSLDRRWLRRIGVDPRIVRAGALLAGPYDFAPFTEYRGRNAFGHWKRPEETQPISFARRSAPPLLLATGSNDKLVYPRNSRHLAQRLAELGAPAEFRSYRGVGHIDLMLSFSRTFRGRSPALADVTRFLLDHS